jgi:putative methyltransferase (TIGR04325 family)
LLSGRRVGRFRGYFQSYEEALAAVHPELFAGYDNDATVDVNFDEMASILPSDARVIQNLERLLPQSQSVLDAGGHMGTKYRAYRERLKREQTLRVKLPDPPIAVPGVTKFV